MVERWYPRGVSTPEERLRYYASRFDTVEVDSTFYALPRRDFAEAWVRRTPDEFVFHVKAYGMMTGHEVDARALAPELRDYEFEISPRGRVCHRLGASVGLHFARVVHGKRNFGRFIGRPNVGPGRNDGVLTIRNATDHQRELLFRM